jgi:hypothetical protein
VEHNLGEISTCDNKTKKHNRKITKAKKNKQKQPKEPKKRPGDQLVSSERRLK